MKKDDVGMKVFKIIGLLLILANVTYNLFTGEVLVKIEGIDGSRGSLLFFLKVVGQFGLIIYILYDLYTVPLKKDGECDEPEKVKIDTRNE